MPEDQAKKPLLTNGTYDLVRQTVQYGLPGAGALYFALAQIWGLPYAEEIVGTIAAITVFLGIILGISRRQYENSDAKYDGDLKVDQFGNAQVINFDESPLQKSEVTLKIDRGI